MSRIYLHGLSLTHFRGIAERQRIGPFREINFFIGPNNAGKSTILLFIARYLKSPGKQTGRGIWRRNFDELDVQLGKNASQLRFGFGTPLDLVIQKQLESLAPSVRENYRKLAAAHQEDEFIWAHPNDDGSALLLDEPNVPYERLLDYSAWQFLWRGVTGSSAGDLRAHWIPETVAFLARSVTPTLPDAALVPAIREMGGTGAEFVDYSGKGLIDRLAELQSPAHNEQHKKRQFEKINRFLQTVTENQTARIEIPFDRKHVLVHIDNKVLPLEALGTGIHEVVMLAAFSTILNNQIVCIEEPEIHLHPLLQRRLTRFLFDETSNQYFIATHSASMIDSCPASIFRVSTRDGQTYIQAANTSTERFEICRQLGYRASDILQANAVIWVEGPSDRIYINYWLRAVDSDLVEGTDYSIMFYGGRLLSHLTPSDDDVTQFISLCRLNRNVAIVIDSDKATSRSTINATKQRVVDEIGTGFVWVTEGREIENYLEPELIIEAISTINSRSDIELVDDGKFGHRFRYRQRDSAKVMEADKIKLARAIASRPAVITQANLKKHVLALAKFIRNAVV